MKRAAVFIFWVPLLFAQVAPDSYIVEVAGEPAASWIGAQRKAGRILAAASVEARRAQVRAAQQAVRGAIESRGGQVLDSVDTVANALIVHMPAVRAAALSQIPGVLRVHPVLEMRMSLDHALPLLKVPEAWTRIGGQDKAGAGVKIGIIDSGIDSDHPGFQDSSLPVPEGFPRVNAEADLAYTNTKIIVARSYVEGSPAMDRLGHGTAVAMAAAGVTNRGPAGPITGVAPKAWLGSYKVNDESTFSTTVTLKALDDAVADGMDVINISSGVPTPRRVNEDVFVAAVERAVKAGVVVVVSAGNLGFDPDNSGDPNTITSPATAPSAIAVGASTNDRLFLPPSVAVEGRPAYEANPGSGPAPSGPISGTVLDVATLDQTGTACAALPADSLAGKIALILRGVCTFEDKLNNAEKAGAMAAIVYTDADRPQLDFRMNVGNNTLPAVAVSYDDGVAIKRRVQEQPATVFTIIFTISAVPTRPNRAASFSSRGPNDDLGIKPDIAATGTEIYTAGQKVNNNPGYTIADGTSLASPLVAGAAAVLKSFRPGLTAAQYRSLLIGTAAAAAPVQAFGGGILDLDAALRGTVAATPASLSFGAGSATLDVARELTIFNLGTAAETFTISAEPRDNGPAPALSTSTVQIAPGASQTVSVRFTAAALESGEYQGWLRIQGTATGADSRVPYWYGVPSGKPRFIAILADGLQGRPNSSVRVPFRVTDEAGVVVWDLDPTVTAGAGGGRVVRVISIDDLSPGVFRAEVQLGPTARTNYFRIEVGGVSREVAITASNDAP